MKKSFLVLGLVLGTIEQAHAGPMGFKDSYMAMGDFSRNWRESFVNYALSPRDAIGIEGLGLHSDDQSLSRQAVDLTYTRLLKRWNYPAAQANVWFVGGIGAIKGNDFSDKRTLLTPGIQFDYETTRVYFASTARLYRAEGINHDYGSVRAGASFYEVGYDETQPWLIVEARRMRGLSDKTEVTPMLRLIHKLYFIEAGYSNMDQARFNFMYIF